MAVECLGPVTGPHSQPPQPPLRFAADRWLASDAGDGETWVTLTPVTGDASDAGDAASGYAKGGHHPPLAAAAALQQLAPAPRSGGSEEPAAAALPAAEAIGGAGGRPGASASYTIVVHTSDIRGAGEGGALHCILLALLCSWRTY